MNTRHCTRQHESPDSVCNKPKQPMFCRFGYTPVVHCGSVRQAARVVSMAEVPLAEGWAAADACRATGCNLIPAVAAAATLLAQPATSEVSCACVTVDAHEFPLSVVDILKRVSKPVRVVMLSLWAFN